MALLVAAHLASWTCRFGKSKSALCQRMPPPRSQKSAGFAAANRIRIAGHAWKRMGERGAQYEDVRHALAGARRCKAVDLGRWKVSGDDLDGDELILVVAIESGVVVVTVY